MSPVYSLVLFPGTLLCRISFVLVFPHYPLYYLFLLLYLYSLIDGLLYSVLFSFLIWKFSVSHDVPAVIGKHMGSYFSSCYSSSYLVCLICDVLLRLFKCGGEKFNMTYWYSLPRDHSFLFLQINWFGID